MNTDHCIQHYPDETFRVVELPIVESETRPRVVLFEGSPVDAEDFYFRYIERDDVDDFYVIFGTVEETAGRWGERIATT